MAQNILLKRSSTAASVPATGDLLLGELALNTNDGKIFLKKDNGAASIVTVSNEGHIHVIADTTGLQAALDAKVDDTEKGAASGVATLDVSGKVPTAQLPALAITDTFTAADQAAQLALTVQKGDVCVRTDLNQSYIALNSTNGAMTDWQELLTPTDTVLSVNGYTGAITIDTDDVNEGTTNLYYTDARAIAAIGGSKNDAGTTVNDLWSADKINTTITTTIQNTSGPKSSASDPTVNDDSSTNNFVGQVWVNTTNDKEFICADDSAGAAIWKELSSAASTVTGGANVGTAGTGVFKALNGNDLEFKKINTSSARLSVTDDVANDKIDLDVVINDAGTTVNDLWSADKINTTITASIQTTSGPKSSASDPTVNDDSSTNNFVGQVWVNTTSDRQFIALDVSAGAAIWKEITFTDDTLDGGTY